jgi:tripartite-type tricarboxylate transporter receptor subunit TctC
MHRIPLLLVLTAVMLTATLAAAPVSAADPAPALTILEPYGAGSATDRLIEILRPSLEKRTGHRRSTMTARRDYAAEQQAEAAAAMAQGPG